MLGSPSLSFTIPSILDDTVLDARVYFPERFHSFPGSKSWRKKAAIVAHPYAPLGGCYDDPVVDLVASAILNQGFVVGTFNFRGAGSSKGRTTFTSKGETHDYISIVGFMTYFMQHLEQPPDILFNPSVPSAAGDDYFDLSPIEPQIILKTNPASKSTDNVEESRHLLLLGGYSYGALITIQLPHTESLLAQFKAPSIGTAAAEIRLRAHELAKQQNENLKQYAKAQQNKLERKNEGWRYSRGRNHPAKHAASTPMLSAQSAVRVGGEETDPSLRRSSSDAHGRQSLSLDTPDRFRKSMDRVRSLGRPAPGSPRRHHSYAFPSRGDEHDQSSSNGDGIGNQEGDSATSIQDTRKVPNLEFDDFRVCYLLISPLQGLTTNLLTMWKYPTNSKQKHTASKPCHAEEKLTTHDTLAVFGDSDIFSSIKKLRQWAVRLTTVERSRFRYVEISGAGHFWHEEGVAARMRAAVLSFIEGL